jgi:transcriptional regulator with PAS, ATPase and Fis domain
MNRRSIHRAIAELDIDVDTVRRELLRPTYYQREAVDNILRKTFDSYKQVLHPDKLEQIYNHMPELTDDIVKEVPIKEMTWKQAEAEFEKQFITKVLDQYKGNITRSAKKMKLRYETLIRKMKKLGISS